MLTPTKNKEKNIFEIFKTNHIKKLKLIKGDLDQTEEYDEKVFNEFYGNNSEINQSIKILPVSRQSIMFKLIPKNEFNIIRERSPTPEHEKTDIQKAEIEGNKKRSLSKENLTTMNIGNGNNLGSARGVSKINVIEKPFEKLYTINSNSKSTIKAPEGCKKIILYFFLEFF
jgi:hypothetical protein